MTAGAGRQEPGEPVLDLIVRGGWLWSGARTAPLEGGAVGVRDGLVVAVDSFEDLAARAPGAPVIGGPGRLVMPGLVNAHTHLAMTLFRGLADDLPLMEWLQDHVWPAESRRVGREMVRAAGLLGMAEMIRSGTTCFADAYFHPLVTARTVAEVGLRAVVAPGVIDLDIPNLSDRSRNQANLRQALERLGGFGPGVRGGVFCHAPYTCGPETYRWAKDMAREFGVRAHTHLAETAGEAEMIRQRHGLGPVPYLDAAGFLDADTVLVHAVHLEAADLALLARRGVAMVTCPESNLKLAAGRADVAGWLDAGLGVGLGTDGAASNNDLNMIGEAGTLARLHKGATGDPTVMPAETVLDLATRGGAAALGWEKLGRLEPGWLADVITLDLDQPHLTPLHHLAAQVVYAAHGGEVRETVVGGRVLMEDGRLTTLDLERTMAEVRRLARG